MKQLNTKKVIWCYKEDTQFLEFYPQEVDALETRIVDGHTLFLHHNYKASGFAVSEESTGYIVYKAENSKMPRKNVWEAAESRIEDHKKRNTNVSLLGVTQRCLESHWSKLGILSITRLITNNIIKV